MTIILVNTEMWADLTDKLKTTLPEGENGIAAKYPGDEDIEKDPNIIFSGRTLNRDHYKIY